MEYINKLLWGFALFMLLGGGIYFTIVLRFAQFKIKNIINSFRHDESHKDGVTPFETLTMALASRIGVGSLAGVSLAIYHGGIGAIFWMWVSALVCSINAFSESILGVIYRVQDKDNLYKGGPSYYIERGLGKKKLSKIYAVIIILAYILGFLTIQANTIVRSITEVFQIENFIIALAIMFFTMIIIFRGVKGIAVATSRLVPFMSVTYVLVVIYILTINIHLIPAIFVDIISSALNVKSFSLGFITTLIIGIQRGIFSNEAGIGSGAIASALSNTNNPVKQGYIQMMGVYFTTLVICTLTAFVVILSKYESLVLQDVNGIEITQYAFNYHIGEWGNYIIMISIILFAFSTIITGYYYGESNLKFLFRGIGTNNIIVFKFVVLLLLFGGCLVSADVIWNVVDTFVVLMAIINMSALFMLKKDITDEYRYYRYRKRGIIKNRW
jgi:alanine or glycine:cation symporter, AGCS family